MNAMLLFVHLYLQMRQMPLFLNCTVMNPCFYSDRLKIQECDKLSIQGTLVEWRVTDMVCRCFGASAWEPIASTLILLQQTLNPQTLNPKPGTTFRSQGLKLSALPWQQCILLTFWFLLVQCLCNMFFWKQLSQASAEASGAYGRQRICKKTNWPAWHNEGDSFVWRGNLAEHLCAILCFSSREFQVLELIGIFYRGWTVRKLVSAAILQQQVFIFNTTRKRLQAWPQDIEAWPQDIQAWPQDI